MEAKAISIIKKSLSKNTWKQYETALHKYFLFCKEKNLNLWDYSISNYLSFLSDLHDRGLGYNSANTARSALSTVFGLVHDKEIGDNKLILRFLKGIYKIKPPTSKYSITWDSNLVLNLLESWDSEIINLKQLSFKLVSILALTTAQRVQTLQSIKISNIIWGDPVQIKLDAILKTTKITNPNPVLILPSFPNKNVCPVETLKLYISKTATLRSDCDHLFISFLKPFSVVTSQTISRWLCNTLELAKTDTSTFSGHSFRHAAISKAFVKGINTDTIFQRVGWTGKSKMFVKFYNRPLDNRARFAEAILDKPKSN